MFTFETADQKEVRRFRIAQFNGRTATIRAGAGWAGKAIKKVASVAGIAQNRARRVKKRDEDIT